MVADLVVRVAMTAAQKSAATVAAKVATSAAATFAGCVIQQQVSGKINKELASKEQVTEDDIKSAQKKMIGTSVLGAGVCSGLGLIAFNTISSSINS